MKIRVIYSAQLRDAAGCLEEEIVRPESMTLAELVSTITATHGEPVRSLLVDSQGAVHPWILVDQNGTLLGDHQTRLADGDVIRLSSPISGG